MKIANILPCNCINENMPRREFEMYLTHKVLEHPEKFAFLAKDKEKRINTFKILDNSACELGEGLDFDKVLKAAEIIGADEIVLPDIPRSGLSLTRTLQYLVELDSEVLDKYHIAAVCQGETEEQVLSCASQILTIDSIDTIMLPKWYCQMNNSNGLGRHKLTESIVKLMAHPGCRIKSIHWLGLDTGVRELITPIAPAVRSVDTGYLAALSTERWSHLQCTAERPRELIIDLEYMDIDTERWLELTQKVDRLLQL